MRPSPQQRRSSGRRTSSEPSALTSDERYAKKTCGVESGLEARIRRVLEEKGAVGLVTDQKREVITAAARVAPPPWITDNARAKVWAMLQAALRAFPGRCTFKGECMSCIEMIKAGLASATSAKRVLARVYALLIPALEDT